MFSNEEALVNCIFAGQHVKIAPGHVHIRIQEYLISLCEFVNLK